MTIQRVSKTDFTKTPSEKSPDPDLGYAMIPKERYISDAYRQKEWDNLWTKVWLMGCREDDIPEPGDYHVTAIGPEEILIARQADGSVRAFYNVCLHRGNRIMVGQGQAESFKCQYHFWDYKLDGTFKDIPDPETFPQGPPPCSGLSEVKCDTWNSFVFFSLNPEAEPLLDYLGVLPQHLDPYHFGRMVKTMDVTVEWDCNWKASVDAFNESYHVQGIHPELLYFLDDYNIQIDCYDKHSRYLVPFVTLSKRVAETTELPYLIKHAMQEAEMDPADFDGQAREVRLELQKWKRENGARLGLDYSDLNDDQLTDDYHYLIFPNLTLNTHADDLMLFRQRPHPTDPDKMFFDMFLFKLLKDGEEPPEKPVHAEYKHGEISLGLVVDQDAYNLPGVQRGMHSSGIDGLWIGDQELRIRHFHKVLADYVGE